MLEIERKFVEKLFENRDLSEFNYIEELSIEFDKKVGKKFSYINSLHNLKKLHITSNSYPYEKFDFNYIKDLRSLEDFRIDGFYFDDISPLKFLTKLKSLRLKRYTDHMNISDIMDISSLRWLNLKTLILSTSLFVQDFTPIHHMRELEHLKIGDDICFLYNKPRKDLSFLSKMEKLKVLRVNFSDTHKDDLNFLNSLNSLKHLEIGCLNNLTNVDFIKPFENIDYLSLWWIDPNIDIDFEGKFEIDNEKLGLKSNNYCANILFLDDCYL